VIVRTQINTQPILGVVASAIVVTLSLLAAVTPSPEFVSGWIGLVLTASVPTLMIEAMVWKRAPFMAWRQPARGIASVALNAVIGVVVATAAIYVFGGGQFKPTPFVIIPLVASVPITLGQIALFDCWPFSKVTRSSSQIGLMVLAATYGTVVLIARVCFSYIFLRDAPFYDSVLDPKGAFDARYAVTMLVASVGSMLALVALDFCPVRKLAQVFPMFERQPWRGLASLGVVALMTAVLWLVCVIWWRMDIATFQAEVCVSFIFGMFVLLEMLQGKIFPRVDQPLKGCLVIGVAALIAIAAYALYGSVAVQLRGLADLSSSRALETWISTAMLAITFPGMVVFANFFEFWPLRGRM
jgi:hypothetical protein